MPAKRAPGWNWYRDVYLKQGPHRPSISVGLGGTPDEGAAAAEPDAWDGASEGGGNVAAPASAGVPLGKGEGGRRASVMNAFRGGGASSPGTPRFTVGNAKNGSIDFGSILGARQNPNFNPADPTSGELPFKQSKGFGGWVRNLFGDNAAQRNDQYSGGRNALMAQLWLNNQNAAGQRALEDYKFGHETEKTNLMHKNRLEESDRVANNRNQSYGVQANVATARRAIEQGQDRSQDDEDWMRAAGGDPILAHSLEEEARQQPVLKGRAALMHSELADTIAREAANARGALDRSRAAHLDRMAIGGSPARSTPLGPHGFQRPDGTFVIPGGFEKGAPPVRFLDANGAPMDPRADAARAERRALRATNAPAGGGAGVMMTPAGRPVTTLPAFSDFGPIDDEEPGIGEEDVVDPSLIDDEDTGAAMLPKRRRTMAQTLGW